MYCPQCGKEYTQQVNFCCHCGTALAAPKCTHARKLTLSRSDKKIAGVCAGFARYFDIDVTVVRILWLMLGFLWGWGAGQTAVFQSGQGPGIGQGILLENGDVRGERVAGDVEAQEFLFMSQEFVLGPFREGRRRSRGRRSRASRTGRRGSFGRFAGRR